MPDYTLPMAGGCRCGRVRFRVTKAPMMETICHCTGCQHMTGSAFSATLITPTDGFEVTAGEPVIGGLHGEQSLHHHCEWCKSWVFTRIEPDMGFVNVRAGALDDPSWFVPFAETYTSEALPWALADAPRQFEKFPAMDDYPGLLAAYAAR